MNVEVDPLLCIGCGLCAGICPEVFEMGVDVAEVVLDLAPLDLEDAVAEAEAACPAEAISITETT